MLAAPMIAAIAQGASPPSIRIEISASGYRLQPRLDSTHVSNGSRPASTPVIGSGKLTYAVGPGEEVTVAATTDTGQVHVEVRDDVRVFGLADGHAVTVRNKRGVISFDVTPEGPHFRVGGIFSERKLRD
jgi:hypothetical protein